MIAHRLEIAQLQRKISALDLSVNNKKCSYFGRFLSKGVIFLPRTSQTGRLPAN